jgi:hypothetical protein
MDFKKLLEAMDTFAGERVGQKPGDQVRGTEKAAPNKGRHPFLKRLVGELKQPKSVHRYEQELSEAWLEFKEAAPVPGQPAAAPGATPAPAAGAAAAPAAGAAVKPAAPAAPVKPGQPVPLDPKTAAAIKTSATAIKQVAPNANPAQLAKAATSIESGVAPSTTDKNAIATSLADPLSNIMQNPQMANQLKAMIDKAGKLDAAADKAAGTIAPAPATPGAPVPPAGTQPK